MFEFELDSGNISKLRIVRIMRGIDLDEILSVFDDSESLIYPAKDDLPGEERFMIVGLSNRKRLISVIFTVRHNKIRPFQCVANKRK